MSIAERRTLDMSLLLTEAYQLGDLINASEEVSQYLYWQRQVQQSEEAQRLIRQFAKVKEQFSECERFGHYHPEYHAALEKVNSAEQEMDKLEAIGKFKQAEKALDELLHSISTMIAHAVSDTVKVPSNDPNPKGKGCGSGGACSCG